METERHTVTLDQDHPGFRDPQYRARRDEVAQLAQQYRSGAPIPVVAYTEAEHAVWQAIWQQLRPAHQQFACRQYLDAFDRMGFTLDRIPQMQEVTTRLTALTGFRMEPVHGLVTSRDFLATMAQGIFLSTQYIRHPATPLYTPEPDWNHEATGHAVGLGIPDIAELSRLFGQAARQARNDLEITELGRMFWFTIEFGVVREDGLVKAYGAGLLSSFGELQQINRTGGVNAKRGHGALLVPLDMDAIRRQAYDVTQYQPILFCADSFAEMTTTIREYLTAWIAARRP
ncbi:MAG: phenylalanine 4-monooxygenase [Deltaproteobacteria bacterium]|nr:phenylalanine 4-monooxygenase [Deltaproteobacteria bacterium]